MKQAHQIPAIQFDFYLPKKIWGLRIVKNFCKSLSSIGGSTVFNEETGIWRGNKEQVQIFRVVIANKQIELKEFRAKLKLEVKKILTHLRSSKEHEQQTMMYTETKIMMIFISS